MTSAAGKGKVYRRAPGAAKIGISAGGGEVAGLVRSWRQGDSAAQEQLWSCVYPQLTKLAHFILEEFGSRSPLSAAELVHEAYLKLLNSETLILNDRRHFVAVAARAMRQILLDHARQNAAGRHGGGWEPLPLEEALGVPVRVDLAVLALGEALRELARLDRRKHEIVALAYYGGLTYEKVGETLGVSPVTVKRDLQAARTWLYHRLNNRPRE